MNDDTPLEGLAVLLVEDDFYLADDARAALDKAGAEVVGPFAHAREALALLETTRPDCAVIDVNLGHGLDFELGRRIRDLRIPLVFATGYDLTAIPADLAAVDCILKPIDMRRLVERVASLTRGRRGPH